MSNVKKVYELVGMDACRMTTTYCGVKVNMEFKNGNHKRNKGAMLITANRFVQDAIEHDPRFGTSFKLAATYPMEVVADTKVAAEEEDENPKKRKFGRGKGAAKTAEVSSVSQVSSSAMVVNDVKTLNDAIDWFAAKGEVLESREQLAELCEKYGVSFPNIKH